MQITELRIRKVEDEGKLRAYVTVTFDNCFVVHNVKIIEGKSGLFIAMPSRKTANTHVSWSTVSPADTVCAGPITAVAERNSGHRYCLPVMTSLPSPYQTVGPSPTVTRAVWLMTAWI